MTTRKRKAGRPAVAPDPETGHTPKFAARIPAEMHEAIKAYGKGNFSRGIRRLYEYGQRHIAATVWRERAARRGGKDVDSL